MEEIIRLLNAERNLGLYNHNQMLKQFGSKQVDKFDLLVASFGINRAGIVHTDLEIRLANNEHNELIYNRVHNELIEYAGIGQMEGHVYWNGEQFVVDARIQVNKMENYPVRAFSMEEEEE